MSMTRVVVHLYTTFVLKFVGLPVPKIWLIFGQGINQPSDRPLTSKWGHGSPVSWASLLPIFSLHSILDLGPGTGQTYRQTTVIIA